jgi:hypothetical protein
VFGGDPGLVTGEPFLEVVAEVGQGLERGGGVVGAAADPVGELRPGDEGLDGVGGAVASAIGCFAGPGDGHGGGDGECGEDHGQHDERGAGGESEDPTRSP